MRKEIKKSGVRKLEAAGGACCFVAGILAAMLGSLLTASGWITGAEVHPWIRGAGTGLLVVTIPLIIFAGFCLDWAERPPNNSRDNNREPKQEEPPVQCDDRSSGESGSRVRNQRSRFT